MATIDKRPLKAYVRFDGTGRIVPSSLILRRKKPKVGNWVEIPAYECCEPTTSTTTSSTSSSTTTTTSSTSSTTTTTSSSSSTTTTTSTTTALPVCFCYTVTNEGLVTGNYTFTTCGLAEPTTTGLAPDSSVIVCSSTVVTGDDGIVITGGTNPCLSAEDCI